MIGYMKPVKKLLSKADRGVYQSIYCGLCRCLKYEYGFTGMAALNYEVVNVLLLIGAMDPNGYPEMVMSCSLTPLYWRPMMGVNQDGFHAAAAVTIAAAAMEIEDNLHDADKWYDRIIHSLIAPKAEKTMLTYREDMEILRASYARFMELEGKASRADPEVTFQMLAGASGEIIAQAARIVGTYANCQQLKALYAVMYCWGQWIYGIDAVDDYEADRKNGQFNPLFLPDKPDSVSAWLETLEDQANFVLDTMVLRNDEALVHTLFHVHMPYRRSQVIGSAPMSQIEEVHHEPSIPSEN